MADIDIGKLIQKTVKELSTPKLIPIEASARHVHLSKSHIEELFGAGYEPKIKKELSQPGQYQYNERVMLIGPKGVINGIAILGPPRGSTQVELSKTDAVALGIDAPVRESGNLTGSPGIIISSGSAVKKINEGVIIAKRHIHMKEEDGEYYGVKDKQLVCVKTLTDRPLTFEDVVVRISNSYSLSMHIDYDEANACGFKQGVFGRIFT